VQAKYYCLQSYIHQNESLKDKKDNKENKYKINIKQKQNKQENKK
jgi:hypothetical protein